MTDFAALRNRMVERQVIARGITDRNLTEALRIVPRELFVPEHLRDQAYEDAPLPIEADQTISQPYIVALMIGSARVGPGSRVLEIGAGSGYAVAVMAQLGAEVFAIERHAVLARLAAERLTRLGYDRVTIRDGDGSQGWPENAPFDAILASASGSHVPRVLVDQLIIGGRLVMPVGEPQAIQTLLKIIRTSEGDYEQQDLGTVRFVPLIGAHGWRDE